MPTQGSAARRRRAGTGARTQESTARPPLDGRKVVAVADVQHLGDAIVLQPPEVIALVSVGEQVGEHEDTIRELVRPGSRGLVCCHETVKVAAGVQRSGGLESPACNERPLLR